MIKDVNFTYADGSKALSDINLQIQPGQFVCVTGLSGSGKSSFLRILTGAFKNFSGSVLIDGVHISNYSLSSLRSQTGILFGRQDVFKGTLLENITMGNTGIQINEVNELAEKIGVKKYIQNLKNGLNTLVDSDGKKLPKKIKKDILLMRALVSKHRLLLLEEPFEHLGESQRNNVLDFLKNDRNATIIITTETPPNVKYFDVLVSLAEGKIKSIQ